MTRKFKKELKDFQEITWINKAKIFGLKFEISFKTQNKMKNQIFSLSVLFLISCNSSSETDISDLIKGDWKMNLSEKMFNPYSFSFEDSTASYLYSYRAYTPYHISGDTLFMTEKIYKSRAYYRDGQTKIKTPDIFRLQIIDINDSILRLKSLDEITLNEFPELLDLRRITSNNNINFKRLAFYSTACYGTCPVQYLELDSNGNILYHGESYTEKPGLFSGKISSETKKTLTMKIQNVYWNQLKPEYYDEVMHSPSESVLIQDEKNTYQVFVWGTKEEPVELKILLHKLRELHKEVHLIPDSTITNRYDFKEFEQKRYPPPPPPLPDDYRK